MTKWDYCEVRFRGNTLEVWMYTPEEVKAKTFVPFMEKKPEMEARKQMALLGNQGWEMVAVVPILKDGNTEGHLAFFKRPRGE